MRTEQRRTTAAVIAGFASLEIAIDRLGVTVESSSRTLASRVGSLAGAVTSSAQSVGAEVRDASNAQGTRDAMALAQLNHTVWLLDDQRQRALGWRR